MKASLPALMLCLAAGLGATRAAVPTASAPRARAVIGLDLSGAIGPASARYVVHGLRTAARRASPFVILEIDTPGGLEASMREIVKAILASPVPVVGYVAPPGARAASAGTYILYACPVAAMAPATNLGAATPVSLGGSTPAPPTGKERAAGPPMSAEQRKILNDSVAYIRALAELRGRNAQWAEQAVRGAASLPAEDALRAHVVNLIAPDLPSLLSQLNGRRVVVRGHTETLDTTGVTVVWLRPGWRTRVLAVITNPMIAYGLLLIGIWGLIFEGFHPGGVLPGVVGVIALLVALFAFQLLPTDFAGLALIAVGSAMMAGEFFLPTYGSLGLGGLIGFVVGSLILFDAGGPGMSISRALIGAIATVGGLVVLGIVYLGARARRRPLAIGAPAMVGGTVEAEEDIGGGDRGRVRYGGELWNAVAASSLRRGQRARIVKVEGLQLWVEPL